MRRLSRQAENGNVLKVVREIIRILKEVKDCGADTHRGGCLCFRNQPAEDACCKRKSVSYSRAPVFKRGFKIHTGVQIINHNPMPTEPEVDSIPMLIVKIQIEIYFSGNKGARTYESDDCQRLY